MRRSRVSTLAAAGLLATLWAIPALPSAPRSVGPEPEDAAPSRAATPDPPRRLRMHLHVASWKEDIRRIAPLGLDIAGTDLRAGILDVLGTADDAARLEALGIPVTIVRDLDAEGVTVADERYLDPGEVEALLWGYAAAHPGILDLRLLGVTEEGRPYYAAKISDNAAAEEDEPAVLFDFEHHAREVMVVEVAIDLIDRLLTRYGVDADVTRWVDGTEIWVIPNHNPDGSNHVFTADDFWRKNRRNNGDGTFGVDPNRNYPFQFGLCGGSSSSTGSELYRGPFALSEPETQALTALALEQRPVINLSYHTYGELVLYPYGCSGTFPNDKDASGMLGERLARAMVRDSGSGSYDAGYSWAILNVIDGESKSWLHAATGGLSYTVELNASSSGGFQPDYDTWRTSTVLRARSGWQLALDRLEGPSVRGHITDACTGLPLEATVGIDDLPPGPLDGTRASEPLHGRYQWMLLLGDYSLRYSKTGYHTQAHPIEVRRAPVDLDVALVPVGSRGIIPGAAIVEDLTGDGDGRIDPGETVVLRVSARAVGEAVTGVSAVLTSADPYVTVLDGAASYPDLAAGEEALPAGDGFQVAAAPWTPEDHVPALAVSFSAGEALCADGGALRLPVTTASPACAVVESLDADPGWTISGGADGWEFGQPVACCGGAGPGAAATGSSVYGTNLDGPYDNGRTLTLMTPAWDLSRSRGNVLEFARWISTEEGFDHATVEASADGATWELLWTGTATDRAWRTFRLDAPAVDRAPAARFRFTLATDGSVTDAGFYLDDVAVCGDALLPGVPLPRSLSLKVIDDTANTACTDADGAADAGEIIMLRLTADNEGLGAALGATARLVTSDPAVEVLDGPLPLGDLAPGGPPAEADFLARIDSSAACGASAPLTVEFRFNGGARRDAFAPPLLLERDGPGCDANECPAACAPAAEIGGVAVDPAGRLTWVASADPCHATAGIGYRVYRATTARPLPQAVPPYAFPADTAFEDVSIVDGDGSLLDAGYDDADIPPYAGVFYYLIVDVGTDGSLGPLGHYSN